MKITIYTSKGGAGKTPISANIALDREFAIGTNEAFHILDEIFPDDRILTVPADEPFPELPDDIDIVFDLAGSISKSAQSITSAIRQSDLVIVPIFNEPKSRKAGIGTILEIESLTKNILIVATKLQSEKGELVKDWSQSRDFLNIERDLKVNIKTPYPMLPLKLSTAFDTIFEKERSVHHLMSENPLLRHSYKDIGAQITAIYSFIDQIS